MASNWKGREANRRDRSHSIGKGEMLPQWADRVDSVETYWENYSNIDFKLVSEAVQAPYSVGEVVWMGDGSLSVVEAIEDSGMVAVIRGSKYGQRLRKASELLSDIYNKEKNV